MIDCEYYVPAWEGSKTSGKQPAFCLKYRVSLYGKCLKDCSKKEVKKNEMDTSKRKVTRQDGLLVVM